MKKFSIDTIVMVYFCALRYDCRLRTMIWCGSNIRFPCKYMKNLRRLTM